MLNLYPEGNKCQDGGLMISRNTSGNPVLSSLGVRGLNDMCLPLSLACFFLLLSASFFLYHVLIRTVHRYLSHMPLLSFPLPAVLFRTGVALFLPPPLLDTLPLHKAIHFPTSTGVHMRALRTTISPFSNPEMQVCNKKQDTTHLGPFLVGDCRGRSACGCTCSTQSQ